MGISDIKQALSSTREMDCYLEATSSEEIIKDILSFIPKEAELRDHFAAMALPAVMTQTYTMLRDENSRVDDLPKIVSTFSYNVADAMLAARKVGP